jgi:hypothetical protein
MGRVAVLLVSALCLVACTAKPTVVGKWKDVDGSVWEFTKDGRVVAEGLTPISYTIDGPHKLTYTFMESVDQGLKIVYHYTVTHDRLVLTAQSITDHSVVPADLREETFTRVK